jgi:hypothetical protein
MPYNRQIPGYCLAFESGDYLDIDRREDQLVKLTAIAANGSAHLELSTFEAMELASALRRMAEDE